MEVGNSTASPSSTGRIGRAVDWGLFALIVLAIGPVLGGFFVGVLLDAVLIFHGTLSWPYLAMAIGISVSVCYGMGEPIAALALIIFILLTRFFQKRSIYLAMFSGVLSSVLIQAVVAVRGNSCLLYTSRCV